MTSSASTPNPAVGGTKRAGRLHTVDALRAIAALMVVLRHSALGEGTYGAGRGILTSIAELGAEGVGLFLVISGFSIHLRWAAAPGADFSPGAFWKRRFVRLYPTYYVAVGVILIATIVVFGTAGVTADRNVHEAFIFNENPIHFPLWGTIVTHLSVVVANIWFVALLPQAWSLALEEQIYALYTLLLKFVREIRPVRLAVGTLVLALLFNVGVSLLASPTVASGLIYTQVPSRLFEWVLGLLAAEAYFGHVSLPAALHRLEVGLAALVAAAICGLTSLGTLAIGSHRIVLTEIIYHPLAGLSFFVVLSWAIRNERSLLNGITRTPVRLLAWIGLFSYSIYLLHPAIMTLLGEYIPGRGVLRRAVLWLAVIGVSYVFYVLVERRFVRRARLVSAPAPEPQAATPA